MIKCDSLLEVEKQLIGYTDTISVSGLDIPLKNLHDNLNQVEYPCILISYCAMKKRF